VKEWPEFRTQLREIRRAGYAVTDSELVKGRIGLAAPIMRGDQLIAGVSLVGMLRKAERARIPEYVPHLLAAATRISNGISSDAAAISR
jgi:DNA-binding IclR family transcriptional regulator